MYLCKDKEDIFEILKNVKQIIRGKRNQEDVDYVVNFCKKHGLEELLDKTIFIKQDPTYNNISSTKYKIAYASLVEDVKEFPAIYSFLDKQEIDKKCVLVKVTDEDLEVLKENILKYFKLVSNLESKRYFK